VISEIEFAAPSQKAVTIGVTGKWKDDYNHVDLSFA
jgi:hypothetical protein